MKVGIVGSRRRTDKFKVFEVVDSLDDCDIVVSGGCIGVDSWAIERAKERGLGFKVFFPKLRGCRSRFDMIKAFYARNKEIAGESDVIYAFVASDRKGGTENTISWAEKLGKKVILV